MARALCTAFLLLLLVPAAAGASEVALEFLSSPDPRSGQPFSTFGLSYRADPGEANDVTVVRNGATVDVKDAGATIRAGENCMPVTGGVQCRATADPVNITASTIDLGDLADKLDLGGVLGGNVRGGPGNDTITAGGYVTGDAGDDILTVGRYTFVDGGPGADRITGTDSELRYEGRTAGLRVSFDETPNDGEAGEGDDIRGTFVSIHGGGGDDVLEASGAGAGVIYGFAGDDRLIGSGADESFGGYDGDDVIEAGGGNDFVNAGAGADVTRGGPGTDTFANFAFGPVQIIPDNRPGDGTSGEGDDVGADFENFSTGSGADHIEGTDGPNVIDSGGGSDVVNAHGGDDSLYIGCCGGSIIHGGTGRDTFHPSSRAGSGDLLRMRDGEADVLPRCELGETPTIEADEIDDASGCASFVRLARKPVTIRASGRSPIGLSGTCVQVGTARCTGELRLYARPRTGRPRVLFARGRYDVPARAKRVVRLAFTRAGKRALAASSRVKFLASSHPDLNPPPSVVWPEAHQTVSGVLLRKR